MTFKLSESSLQRLVGVHPDLVKVVKMAIGVTTIDFGVTEGLRTVKRQRELFLAGASRTMKSRHLTGHAVDLVAYMGGEVRWDWPLYDKIAHAMKESAHLLDIKIVWGGDWKTFKDGPHFELDREAYP